MRNPFTFEVEELASQDEIGLEEEVHWEDESSTSPTDEWVIPDNVRRVGESQFVSYDDGPLWDSSKCAGSFTAGGKVLREYLKANFKGISSIGGLSCRSNSANTSKMSIHGIGRALDIMIPKNNGKANSAVGDPIANWLVLNAAAIGIQYLIWNRVRWSGSRKSFGRYGGPNPHTDHIHVELNEDGANRRTPWFSGGGTPIDVPTPIPIPASISRSSKEYIRWVQQSLNQILGLRLVVDGISGTQTRSAIRSFQQRQGLVVDGIVGPQTEGALIAAGAGQPPGSPSYQPPGGGSRIQLATQILMLPNVGLLQNSPTNSSSTDGADASSNIHDTAAGNPAKRSAYGNAPGGSVYLDSRLLSGILSLANSYSFKISSIAGGSHSSNSRHYAGIACDVYEINGNHVSKTNPFFRAFMQTCKNLGATEVLGPGSQGHDTHVHFAWPRP